MHPSHSGRRRASSHDADGAAHRRSRRRTLPGAAWFCRAPSWRDGGRGNDPTKPLDDDAVRPDEPVRLAGLRLRRGAEPRGRDDVQSRAGPARHPGRSVRRAQGTEPERDPVALPAEPGVDRGPGRGVAGAAGRGRAIPQDPGQPAERRRRIQSRAGAAVRDGLDPKRLRPRGVGRALRPNPRRRAGAARRALRHHGPDGAAGRRGVEEHRPCRGPDRPRSRHAHDDGGSRLLRHDGDPSAGGPRLRAARRRGMHLASR